MAQEKSELFRKKNLDRASSPEQLDDYIRVTSPSVWLILIALIVLLSGAIVWSVLGTVEGKDAQGEEKEIHPITFVTN